MKTNHYNTLYPTMKDAIDKEITSQLEGPNDSVPVEDLWDIKSIADEAIESKTMYDENGTQIVYYHLKPVYDNPYVLWLLVCKHHID